MSTVDTMLETADRAATTGGGDQTPTTPRPATTLSHEPLKDAAHSRSGPVVAGVDASKTELPTIPTTPQHGQHQADASTPSLKRDGSQRSPPPTTPSGQDVEMGDGDDDGGMDEDGSDNDSVTSESQRPSKKKKGQRFFCTDFPPCQLSFTRSEHLARHIRKHTGERPFQCHCSRRFSRLDNLRQHAQTVHLNEEIPGDSLAATSTRFQRQIRTDRVRPPTNRSRASTIGSNNGGHSRGHSRNLSTSSIASTASSVGASEDTRRRPQPLAMANDSASRARLSLDTYHNSITASPSQGQYAYYNQSPSGYSSPTSTVYSMGTGSPRFQSGMLSPVSTVSRSSFYNGARQGRRLSVPSGPNPFQSPNANTYPPPMYYNPMAAGSPGVFSQANSVIASPVNSVFSIGRRDSEAELEFRRRTWHPSTYSNYPQRAPTSGLSYHQTPDDHRPAPSDQPAASQVTRLPGIESFDHAPPSGSRPPSDPMVVESSPRAPTSARPSDAGLHQNLTRLDITAANAPVEGQWHAVQQPQPHQLAPQAYMGGSSSSSHQPATVAPQHVQQHMQPAPPPQSSSMMAEPPVTPRRNKRQAWYGGPVSGPITPQSAGRGGGVGGNATTAHRPSPEDSGSSDGVPTPGTSQGIEYHPVIVNPNGTAEAYSSTAVSAEEQKAYVHAPDQPPQTYALQAGHDPHFAASYSSPANNDMGRLEALVAVATSENRAVERS